jgi:hypothetical protein
LLGGPVAYRDKKVVGGVFVRFFVRRFNTLNKPFDNSMNRLTQEHCQHKLSQTSICVVVPEMLIDRS